MVVMNENNKRDWRIYQPDDYRTYGEIVYCLEIETADRSGTRWSWESLQEGGGSLPPDQEEVITKYCDVIFSGGADTEKFFYRLGLRDGMHIYKIIKNKEDIIVLNIFGDMC